MVSKSSNLQNYIDYLSLPRGLFPAIDKVYRAMDGRIWLIDNSYAMNEMDSHVIRSDPDFEQIAKHDGVSRWDELSQCVEFHIKMASRVWIPTQFRLLNECEGVPCKFNVCWGQPDEVKIEREYIMQSLNNVRLEKRVNHLAKHLRKLAKYLDRDSAILRRKNEYVAIIICTHGVPTDENGERGRHVVKEFMDSLAQLAELPVKIIFRLTTDDDKVLEFFGSLDIKFDCDVLDDFWGEAMEVYLHNPWLSYGIGIHRIREAGLGTDILDNLDEKPFTLEEIREFCIEFFLGNNPLSLRNPKVDVNGFFEDLQNIVDRERNVWNPIKNKRSPWIDVEKLKLMTFKSLSKRSMDQVSSSFTQDSPQAFSNGERYEPSHEHIRRATVSSFVHKPPEASSNGESYDQFYRRNTMQSFEDAPANPKVNYMRSASHGATLNRVRGPGMVTRQNSSSGPKDLKEAIQQWSRVAPNYKKLKPLESLLVDVPNLFPPKNSFVESHEHFFKWKEFSEDAFIGESGDGLNELLKRASRKSKLFLHPDKLPTDLTHSQATLFKSMWDVIQESEAETL